MIRVDCPKCGNALRVADQHAGKKGKCPKCGSVLMIPASAEPAPATDPADALAALAGAAAQRTAAPPLRPAVVIQPAAETAADDDVEEEPAVERFAPAPAPAAVSPAVAPARAPATPAPAATGEPKYKWLSPLGWVFTIMGFLQVIGGTLFCLFALVTLVIAMMKGGFGAPTGKMLLTGAVAIIGQFLVLLVLSTLWFGAGQAMWVLRDIARNSWQAAHKD